jgi:phosphate transport system permease protein
MSTATTTIEHAAPPESGPRAFVHRLRHGDEVAHLITLIFAAIILLITSLLVFELWVNSHITRSKFGFGFFATSTWDPVFGNFGAAPFIYGTLVTAVVSLAIAVPLGLAAAIFLAELAPRKLSDTTAFLIDLLAAVPSVIYGLLGIFVVVPLMRTTIGPAIKSVLGFLPIFKGPNYGVGLLTASIVLAIMVVPFIISVSREVLLTVPRDQREAALALGATRWEATWKVVVPWARTGVMGSVFLALARALGETMAVTMVIGNDPRIAASLFGPGYTIAAVIANEFAEATSDMHVSALMELGLVLFLITFILNGLARLLIVATERGGGRPA